MNISLFHRAALATLLTLVIVFSTLLAFEMRVKREHGEFMVLVNNEDFEVPQPFELDNKLKELDQSIEEMLQNENLHDNYKNIAVNKSREVDLEQTQTKITEQQSEEEYRKQLIKDAIGEDDFDKYITNKSEYVEQDIEVPANDSRKVVKKEVYTGPSNIVFYLDDREMLYLQVPVYLCQGEAKVTVKIVVLASGRVERTIIDTEATTTTDNCYIEAALGAAQNARFTKGKNAKQNGKIEFRFVAQ